LQGAGEEGIMPGTSLQFDGLPGFAMVDCLLDAIGIGIIFVGFGQRCSVRSEASHENGAGRRNFGFRYLTGVLAMGAEQRGGNKKGREQNSHIVIAPTS
jgi:hypothetical protein